jgi:hypothetical protein
MNNLNKSEKKTVYSFENIMLSALVSTTVSIIFYYITKKSKTNV